MYDVRRLRLLREVALRGTLAEAAAALRFSPSTVSQQLTVLEREVGTELLRPVGRGVVLTAAAEVLVRHAATILDSLERAEAEIAALGSAVVGTVRLAVFQSAAIALLPETLTRMRTEFPNVRVEVVQHEPEQALRETWARSFDLVVAEQYPGHATAWHDGLDRHVLVSDALRLAVDGTSRIRDIADAAAAPWVMEPVGTASRHWSEQLCRRAGFEPDVRYETADLQTHIRLIESGNAVAVLPDLVWAERPTTVRLVTLPGSPRRDVFTASRTSSTDRSAVSAVRSVLEDVAASPAAE